MKWSDESITVCAKNREIEVNGLESVLCCGRRVHENLKERERVKESLKICQTLHGADCQPLTTVGKTPEGFRILDLHNECIIDGIVDNTRYVSLSHVWGRAHPFVLTKATYLRLIKSGGLSVHWRELPKTIKDTILFCRSGNENYLWIDSLCFIQDDSIDKCNQVNKMGSIYAGAALTIITAEGVDCNVGLAGISWPRQLQMTLPINDIELITVHHNSFEAVLGSGWDLRAWTYQEYRLSTRKLPFTRFRVV